MWTILSRKYGHCTCFHPCFAPVVASALSLGTTNRVKGDFDTSRVTPVTEYFSSILIHQLSPNDHAPISFRYVVCTETRS